MSRKPETSDANRQKGDSPAENADLVTGIYERGERGAGHLRMDAVHYRKKQTDPAISAPMAQAAGLRGGETIAATVKTGKSKNRSPRMQVSRIETINNLPAPSYLDAKSFEDLTAVDPRKQIRFETPGGPTTMRVIDLLTPIGFGQRGLIVAPPRTGKTVLLQQMAAGIAENYPDVFMLVLLIDERPEEVTDMRRTVRGEVVASSNDHDASNHIRLAELMSERAKRLVECGLDVVVLLDSLTRLGRAFNTEIRGRGRIMSGGLDASALAGPKAIFGAARNAEEGGSLTIIATALIETGSRMDEVIFNEFKGTGNMEIVLSRNLANRRVWPAIDLQASGTRKEELLLTKEAVEVSYAIRRNIIEKDPVRSMESLLDSMMACPNNEAFISSFAQRGLR